jgi:hypothetical protein
MLDMQPWYWFARYAIFAPTMVVRQPLAPNLLVGPVFAPRMDQLDAIAVGHAQGGRASQKVLGPSGMGGEDRWVLDNRAYPPAKPFR